MASIKGRAPVASEADVQKSILAYLKYMGVRAWRQNVGAVSAEHNGRKRFVRFGERGAADVHGVLPGGRYIAVEVKKPGKKPTDAQLLWLRAIDAAGGLAFWASSVEEVQRVVTAVLRDPTSRVEIDGDGRQFLTNEREERAS
jgi:hypothetical protein